jgi:predicted phage terminase large subunit-like protein
LAGTGENRKLGFGTFTSEPGRWTQASPVEGFVYRYLAHHMKYPTPDFHREYYWGLESSNRLLEMSPRGFGKSFRASFFTPLALAALGRTDSIAILSKTAALAERFLGLIKTEIESNKILRADFPKLRRGPKWSSDHLITAGGVEFWAKGWGAQIRGDHPQVIIVDDPEDEESTASETQLDKTYEIFTRTIMGALDDEPGMSDAKVIVIGTNIHPDCLVNKIYTNYENRYDKWAVLFFGAITADGQSIWPERRPISWLEDRRREIGLNAFNAEYMNEPILGDAVLFYPHYFRERYTETAKSLVFSTPAHDKVVLCAVDIAQSMRESADYSAFILGMKDHTKGKVFILDGNAARLPLRHLAREVAKYCDEYQADYVYIEDPLKESTDPEKQSIVPRVFREEFFASGCRTVVRTVRPDKDKYRRALAVQPMAERSEIVWPEPDKCPAGLRKIYDQIIRFPLGAHDDGLDAFVHLCRKLNNVCRRSDQNNKSFVRMGTPYAVTGDM